MNEQEQDQLYRIVGCNIKKYRAEKGLNQTSMASILGLSRTSIVNIEQGRQRPSLHLLWQISDVLSVDIYKIIPSKGDMIIIPEVEGNREVKNPVSKDQFGDEIYRFMKKLSTKNHE